VSVSGTVSEFDFRFLWSNITSLNDPQIRLVSFVKNGSSYKNWCVTWNVDLIKN
jgi:hypothetical protein